MLLTTHSSIRDLRACPEKYRLRNVELLAPDQDAEPLRIGSSYHKAREWDDEPIKGLSALQEAYAKVPDWATPSEWWSEMVMVRELFQGRVRQGFPWKIIQTEMPFSLRIGKLRSVRNAGILDSVLKLRDGRIAIGEIKTTADDIAAGSDYWRKLRLDSQISRYMRAAQKMGHEAVTVIYDVTRKPSIRPKNLTKKDIDTVLLSGIYLGASVDTIDMQIVEAEVYRHRTSEADLPKAKKTVPKVKETPELYGIRLKLAIDEDPGHYYQVQEIPRMERDLLVMDRRLEQDIEEIRWRTASGVWQRNEFACTAMGRCPFLDICSNGVDVSTTTPVGFHRLDKPHPELGA